MQRHLDQLLSLRHGLSDDKNQLQWKLDENQLQPSQIDSISHIGFENEAEGFHSRW
jgi:hypothetical protein